MLFNSYGFILGFMPVVLLGYHWLSRQISGTAAIRWLVLCSLFFYGWWNPVYLLLLGGSMAANFVLGEQIHRRRGRPAKLLFIAGVVLNLALIGWFKYAGFLAAAINSAGGSLPVPQIILPLAISFFTFQQIAFLADAYAGNHGGYSFTRYSLFVTFFPQLIAGPIVHHQEMMPQFAANRAGLRAAELSMGLCLFTVGLLKKAVFADSIAQYANPVFDAAVAGNAPQLLEAWGGALAYTLQLYFDFSGYSDMALGLAFCFGIRLPLNFNSPYKSLSIIDFWRRWHMTLSRFLRDYLYIALGGNRGGNYKRYRNLLLTMLLGGLWHGAGWNFLIWGALHGGYLLVNNGWRSAVKKIGLPVLPSWLAWLITMLAVIVGWVFFRATDFSSAVLILQGMLGLNGVSLPAVFAGLLTPLQPLLDALGVGYQFGGGSDFVATWGLILLLSFIAVAMPNSVQLLDFAPIDQRLPQPRTLRLTRLSPLTAAGFVALTLAAASLALPQVSEFLYFQF